VGNRRVRSLAALALIGLVALALPLAARADDGEDDNEADVRVEQSCPGGSTIRLRVRTRDGDELRIDLDVRTPRRGSPWSIVVIHERRIATRLRMRTGSSSGSFSLRRTVPDWPGRDTVTVRAIGPRGEVCRASATLRET